MARYTAKYERDEDGWWIVEVPEVQGCRSDGRTINEARRRVRQALALFVDNAESAEIVDDIRLPAPAKRSLKQVEATRRKASQAQSAAKDTATKAVRLLTKDLGLSVRDAGELLGLSYQRVQQLATGN
jgi:predicted RNase H-like HicB family nuclease